MSIEQLNDFHIVRRILRNFYPEYRLLASHEVEPGSSVLDVKKKTIEVGETHKIQDALPSLLFQVGHLMVKKNKAYALLFGDGIRKWKGTEEELLEKLAKLGASADRIALKWASGIYHSYWSLEESDARDAVSRFVWNKNQWREYFSRQ